MFVEILRLGHRLPRDERISTHVALVGRAFGASSMTYSGQHDSGLEESVQRICENWGGDVGGRMFDIRFEKSAVALIKKRKKEGFAIVHLTMYGVPIQDKLMDMKSRTNVLVVVGSEQVPPEIYQLADFNVSITNQPHSEVAALAITLDRLNGGRELEGYDFKGKLKIVPTERGKKVEKS